MSSISVTYTPTFIKKFNKIPKVVQVLAIRKEEVFKKNPHDATLQIHKLHGSLEGYWAFSINRSYRIMCEFTENNSVTFLYIGTHEIYR